MFGHLTYNKDFFDSRLLKITENYIHILNVNKFQRVLSFSFIFEIYLWKFFLTHTEETRSFTIKFYFQYIVRNLTSLMLKNSIISKKWKKPICLLWNLIEWNITVNFIHQESRFIFCYLFCFILLLFRKSQGKLKKSVLYCHDITVTVTSWTFMMLRVCRTSWKKTVKQNISLGSLLQYFCDSYFLFLLWKEEEHKVWKITKCVPLSTRFPIFYIFNVVYFFPFLFENIFKRKDKNLKNAPILVLYQSSAVLLFELLFLQFISESLSSVHYLILVRWWEKLKPYQNEYCKGLTGDLGKGHLSKSTKVLAKEWNFELRGNDDE